MSISHLEKEIGPQGLKGGGGQGGGREREGASEKKRGGE